MADLTEREETNLHLNSNYLLNVTEEDLNASGICHLVATIPDSDEYYPGCKEYSVKPDINRTIAMLVVSPETGKVYLKSRFGDARDVEYLGRVQATIKTALDVART